MNKIVSYHEFLKHKDNLTNYLHELFDKMSDLTVYFPNSLSSEERHLIYTNSKGYFFEKLHKIGSKYSVKLWKPYSSDIIDEETSDEDLVTVKDADDDSSDPEFDEEYDTQLHLTEISDKLDSQGDKIDKCHRSVRSVECIFTLMIACNIVSSILVVSHIVCTVNSLPVLNVFTEF